MHPCRTIHCEGCGNLNFLLMGGDGVLSGPLLTFLIQIKKLFIPNYKAQLVVIMAANFEVGQFVYVKEWWDEKVTSTIGTHVALIKAINESNGTVCLSQVELIMPRHDCNIFIDLMKPFMHRTLAFIKRYLGF
jgi:hypothetical protein